MATFYGTNSADLFVGTPGNDEFVPWGGDDTIFGGGGDDIFYLDFGNDVLEGGSGRDTYTYLDPVRGGLVITGHEFISDFAAGDQIGLAPIYADLGIESDFWGVLFLENGLGETVLYLDTNGDGLPDYSDFSITFGGLSVSHFEGATLSEGYLALATPTSDIPEPATWLMMLLGLGLCHIATRFRKRQLAAI
ncbi:PEP-CTERM sorting domain-containing protein [Gimibacter soli]|uniref:PEP-CTERM sorting domain-containing protein n=1 Tax=Gimibacter soli TaxID=3024400 RepID=A0AAF0BN62_9PROT|nr:PEP-CTERM sorting domain-containing protein [Gimibacter soli]WCL55605.1 PEP-CTERM sorting domain-containing protein [Gimibacter soli]